jgi:hypothetical protein
MAGQVLPTGNRADRAREAVTHQHDPTLDRTARLIVLFLLERPAGVSSKQLQVGLGDLPQSQVGAATEILLESQVLIGADGILRLSVAVSTIERLGLIAL